MSKKITFVLKSYNIKNILFNYLQLIFFVIDPTLIDSCYDENDSFTFSNHRIIDSNGNKVNIFNALR